MNTGYARVCVCVCVCPRQVHGLDGGISLPPYAINMFVPLVDITQALSTTSLSLSLLFFSFLFSPLILTHSHIHTFSLAVTYHSGP